MVCPNCGAGCSDEAEFCGLCYQSFRAKPAAAPGAAAPPAKGAPARAVFPSATVEAEGWVWNGPLVALPDGFLFFVGTERYQGGLLRRALAVALGDLGGLAGGAVVDSVSEASESRAGRPKAVRLRHRQEAAERYHAALAQAPDLVACDLYFELPRSAVTGLWCHPDAVELDVGAERFEVRGSGDWGGLKAAASAWGYPVLEGGHARPRRRWAYFAAAFLALAGGFAALKDVKEAADLNAKLSTHDGVQAVIFTEEGARYEMNGGEVSAEDVPLWRRLPLYRFGVLFGLLVAAAWIVTELRQLRG